MKKDTLIVFDFDNTLVVSDSQVIVTHADGSTESLDPYEFAGYKGSPDDTFDFSEFERLINPQRIEKYHRIMQAAVKSPRADVLVLSARGNPDIIRGYLQDAGIDDHEVEVIGANSSSGKVKADHIERLVAERGYKDVHFFDDAEHNEEEVQKLKDIGARVNTHLVPPHHYRPLAKKQGSQLNPDTVRGLLRSKIRNPKTGNNILINTALKYDKSHPAHKLARQTLLRHHKQ